MSLKIGTSPPLLIWGASGHARVVADIIRLNRNFRIVGFIDDVDPTRHGNEFCGSIIVGGQEQLSQLYREGVRHIIMGFGDCQARLVQALTARQVGFELATAIHPGTIIAKDVSIGAGTVATAGAVINPGSVIGENVIVNTSSTVDHDCRIAEGAQIGPGAHLGGWVTIGRGTWIGIGAIVKDRVTIGQDTILGAGAVALRDIPSHVIAFGVPAKVIRNINR